ncbi:MAG: hypothetical protein KDA84_11810 [Planctomycetaceae bacterium]|nr:hypothetical protein [Planctomycetaceae bacterium]
MRNLFLASTAIMLATSGVATAREESNPLPSAKEIQAITIEYDHPKEDAVTFQAKTEDWSAIRATLTPAKRDPNPSKWESLGTVHLTKKDGQKVHVYLYTPSTPPGAFSEAASLKQRLYYRGGNTKKLIKVLDQAYKGAQKAE